MPFESLSFRHEFQINDFPDRWLPLIHLYDPDLPLYPIYYFHAVSDQLSPNVRPSESDRVFGYIERINVSGNNHASVSVITNKDLQQQHNSHYQGLALNEVRERLGLNNPVTFADINTAFTGVLTYANPVLSELWNRVVSNAYGGKLPFGRLWDEVLGLSRFVASWYSSGGRKGELIQTHFFSTKFGERVQSAGDIPQIDFYLLPTIRELVDIGNPLAIFPRYSKLVEVAERFQANYCVLRQLNGTQFSSFTNPFAGKLNTAGILSILNGQHITPALRDTAIECYNTFDKGPQRTVIFLMMLSDIRNSRVQPAHLSSPVLGSVYEGLGKSYQSPKVIHIYSQQSYGNTNAVPIDIWIDTFFSWPLKIWPATLSTIFSNSQNLGKVERLIWIAAQARKVHSSACDNAIWCIKKASNGEARGANPLACKVCLTAIRNVCPAFNAIRNNRIAFNTPVTNNETFRINTSSNNNVTAGQKFTSCEGKSIDWAIVDDFSTDDVPGGYAAYPQAPHAGKTMTVQEFIDTY